MSDIIKKLPAVFQTVPQKKFFDATFDQAFSKKENEYIAGYIGRRVPGSFSPVSDYYKPEPTKNRTWWQLEPTVSTLDKDLNRSNIFFYEDMLDKIKFYGGNTSNHSRLFNSRYYSWAPPIDFDMFINYQSYYWTAQYLPTIALYNTEFSDVIGKTSVTVLSENNSTGKEFQISSGMIISFRDDAIFDSQYIVDFGDSGLRLTDIANNDQSASVTYQLLPWDGTVSMQDGTTINNNLWDAKAWEIEPGQAPVDYTVIQRGDSNLWSVNNRWVHIDVVKKVAELTNTPFPSGAVRALRPIIQFDSGLVLYKSGKQFVSTVAYAFLSSGTNAIKLSSVNFKPVESVNAIYGVSIKTGDLLIFAEDRSVLFDDLPNNRHIFQVTVTDRGVVNLAVNRTVNDGDTVRILKTADKLNGPKSNQSWYYEDGNWVRAYNDKDYINQPPLFTLFDHEGVPLDDDSKYPQSTFSGSKIFSYRLDTEPGAVVDPVLRLPILYTSLGQSSDIVFENNLTTNRYFYSNSILPIDGYYYYSYFGSNHLGNGWQLYHPSSDGSNLSCQRVIDRFVYGYDSDSTIALSVRPIDYPGYDNISVTVDGKEVPNELKSSNGYRYLTDGHNLVNNRVYLDLSKYLDAYTPPSGGSVVIEVRTLTSDPLTSSERGYFEIPLQLESNPSQAEVGIVSASDLIPHFSSIIQSQDGFSGIAFGGSNNYRDTLKNKSLGKYILQAEAPMLKSMLVASSDELDVVQAIRFSQNEYASFKNRYLKTAKQLIDSNFDPYEFYTDTVKINTWVDEILKIINVSKEFSKAFSDSYMIPSGEPYATEFFDLDTRLNLILDNYVDLSDQRNSILVYDVSGDVDKLLIEGYDYQVISTNNIIEIEPKTHLLCQKVAVVLYREPDPAYIPSTPTKLGMYGAYIPRIELDTSYAVPTNVIVGHDGSRTVAYNDYRDRLLLELELRIYNKLKSKFKNDYQVPLITQDVAPAFFRQTDYSRKEFLDIIEPHLNRWCSRNKANYRLNEFHILKDDVDRNQAWKLVNYRRAIRLDGTPAGLVGHWRGIFLHYFDTVRPNTAPWEMFGFSTKPMWWESEYGNGILNNEGQVVWTSQHTKLWYDVENGIIRRGSSAAYNPDTGIPDPDKRWARPGISSYIPVDENGYIVPVPILFNLAVSGDEYEPFEGFDDEWQIGDMSPVEYAWTSTSEYVYSLEEVLFLTKPARFGELFWETFASTVSPGIIDVAGVGKVKSSKNYQYVQTEDYSDTQAGSWQRPKNQYQLVHGEKSDDKPNIRYGYQTWISDRLRFLGKSVTDEFGIKVRNLGVSLANKLAGFTNKDTVNLYIESVGVSSSTSTLGIPSENFNVLIHRSPPVDRYTYSGVIVRCIAEGQFAVYGYDLLASRFKIIPRSDSMSTTINVGGTPMGWKPFSSGDTYRPGDIVKYNGVYYSSLSTHSPIRFQLEDWQRLSALPVDGGISVQYRPNGIDDERTVEYGHIFNSIQEVFDFFIGYGDYLRKQGWVFDDIDPDTGLESNWLLSAKQFLYWINNNWAPDQSIQLSPLANGATLEVARGYPDNVETVSNGIYSVLDKYGVAISSRSTVTDRSGNRISVKPANTRDTGIYFIQITASETEHIVVLDNVSSFGDVIYSPLLNYRQARIRFNGFRSSNWYGKKEAKGSFIIGDSLIPNFNSIVENIRHYYDPNVLLDDPNMEDLGRRLIGYESKSYMDNLQVSNDVQYLFYQGAIRQKGTESAISKLYRSSAVQPNDTVEIYEEWALKQSDFGNILGKVSTEFILSPEQHSGEAIVARLNYVSSGVGRVKQIEILNAEARYSSVPRIEISAPTAGNNLGQVTNFFPGNQYRKGDVVRYVDYRGNTAYFRSLINQNSFEFIPANWLEIELTRPALAHAVLDSKNRISRIQVTDQGYGYTSAPVVTIISDDPDASKDILYSIWQGESVKDRVLDNIIDIDIDNVDDWVVRPKSPKTSMKLPTVAQSNSYLPNAGYVNFNDVDWYTFDVESCAVNWGTEEFNPLERDTVWVAKTFVDDWNVYKLSRFESAWKIVTDENDNVLLLTDSGVVLGTQDSSYNNRTDFGNMLVLQSQRGETTPVINLAVGFSILDTNYVDPDNGQSVNAFSLVNLQGVPLTSEEIVGYDLVDTILLFKTLRWATTPTSNTIPTYAGVGDFIWVDNHEGKWTVFKLDVDAGRWDTYRWDIRLGKFWGVSSSGDYSDLNYGWDATGPMQLNVYRREEPLIDTNLFESAEVFSGQYGNLLVQLPVYDPFKGILPGEAKKNLTFIKPTDPARYTVSSSQQLLAKGVLNFGQQQVGQLWWDTSTMRYTYYEQPEALLSDNEGNSESLAYRRDFWGTVFPGSSIDIYEWVESTVAPIDYTGTGVVRNLTDYIAISTPDKVSGIESVRYYFWVKNRTSRPNLPNRTMSALDVGQLLASPRSQGYAFFSPIQQSAVDNSYVFYNVREILSTKGKNVRINFRTRPSSSSSHSQWQMFREGDTNCPVPKHYWDRLVDSICGYTAETEPTGNTNNPIRITNDQGAVEIFAVPNPRLSRYEKLGADAGLRQSMFADLYQARKVFVQVANRLLKKVSVKELSVDLASILPTSQDYWHYDNWYKSDDYRNIKFQLSVSTLTEAARLVSSGKVSAGQLVKVTDGTAYGKYVIYQLGSNGILEEVVVESATIQLKESVYTSRNQYQLSRDLRQILNVFQSNMFVDNNFVLMNQLFSGMMRYVVSEQTAPDWVFKTSLVKIKESPVKLNKPNLFIPDQTNSVLAYISDVKPYHTQVRSYTSQYTSDETADGLASDWLKSRFKLEFLPGSSPLVPAGWDTFAWDSEVKWDGLWPDLEEGELGSPIKWDSTKWDNGLSWDGTWGRAIAARNRVDANTELSDSGRFGSNPLLNCNGNIDQFISREEVYTVYRLKYSPELAGDTGRYPYLIDFGTINKNKPQYDPAPTDTVAILHNGEFLYNGSDFYVEYMGNDVYVAFLKINPCAATLEAFIWFDGSAFDIGQDTPIALVEGNNQVSGRGYFGANPLLVCDGVDQFISQENVYTLDNLVYRSDLRGLSTLFPFELDFGNLFINSPQNQVAASSIVGILKDGIPLINGRDFTVEHRGGDIYTAYLFNDPGQAELKALIWLDGGSLTVITQPQYRTELALASGYDSSVITVKTRLPFIRYKGSYVVPKGSADISAGSYLGQRILASGGNLSASWDPDANTDWMLILDTEELVYTLHQMDSGPQKFIRRGTRLLCQLVEPVPAPREDNIYLDRIRVEVNRDLDVALADILPNPSMSPGVVWIGNERIEYRLKTQIDDYTWDLQTVLRGSKQTCATAHAVGEEVYIEKYNSLPKNSQNEFWAKTDTTAVDQTSPQQNGKYSSLTNVSFLGLWYADSAQSQFLRADVKINF